MDSLSDNMLTAVTDGHQFAAVATRLSVAEVDFGMVLHPRLHARHGC